MLCITPAWSSHELSLKIELTHCFDRTKACTHTWKHPTVLSLNWWIVDEIWWKLPRVTLTRMWLSAAFELNLTLPHYIENFLNIFFGSEENFLALLFFFSFRLDILWSMFLRLANACCWFLFNFDLLLLSCASFANALKRRHFLEMHAIEWCLRITVQSLFHSIQFFV